MSDENNRDTSEDTPALTSHPKDTQSTAQIEPPFWKRRPSLITMVIAPIAIVGIIAIGISIFSTYLKDDDATPSYLSKPAVVKSDVDQNGSAVYEQSIRIADEQAYEKAEQDQESHLPNVAGSFDQQETSLINTPSTPENTISDYSQETAPPEDYSQKQARMVLAMKGLLAGPLKAKTATYASLQNDNRNQVLENQAARDTQANKTIPQTWLIAPGKVFYGQIVTTVNSDLSSPVIAQILQGPLKGERLTGTFQKSRNLVVIKFDQLSYKGQSLAVNAYVVNPDTSEFGVADDVDHHYFERLVLPIAAAALQGVAQGFSQPLTNVSINGDLVVSEQERPDLSDQAINAAGAVGKKYGEILQQDNQITGPTIWVNSGSPVGIAFISGVSVPGIVPAPSGVIASGVPK
ncbi:DotG/IcmE/VirB10 family protein [Kiloniella sp.]|uniref:DotG/IcmE/VirB10 family protein n=1 Tax=Kiloniella sp. TaxID=1938587 RepID=UPI003B02C38A